MRSPCLTAARGLNTVGIQNFQTFFQFNFDRGKRRLPLGSESLKRVRQCISCPGCESPESRSKSKCAERISRKCYSTIGFGIAVEQFSFAVCDGNGFQRFRAFGHVKQFNRHCNRIRRSYFFTIINDIYIKEF